MCRHIIRLICYLVVFTLDYGVDGMGSVVDIVCMGLGCKRLTVEGQTMQGPSVTPPGRR